MASAQDKERLIASAVTVTRAYQAYEAALAENQDIEQASLTWPIADILECATEARRRVGKQPRSEDELLTIFEQMIPNIRRQYAEERRAQLDALNEQFEADAIPGSTWAQPSSIETGAWDR